MSARIRLPRESPWAAQIGCTAAIGLLLGLIGGGILWTAMANHQPFGVVQIVGGSFAFFGVILLLAGIHQAFAAKTAETIVELEGDTVERGGTLRGAIIQPGPVDLQSLRANVVCLETVIRRRVRGGRTETDATTTVIHQWNVLDSGATQVDAGEQVERPIEITIPHELPASMHDDNRTIQWKLEVWGRVRRRPDFMHPFIIEVT